MKQYQNRNEVEEQYKWNLSDIFKDNKELEDAIKKATKDIDRLTEYKGRLNDANILKEYLDFDINLGAIIEKIYCYAYLLNDQELGNPNNYALKDRAICLYNMYAVSNSFFEPELLKIKENDFNELINNQKLSEYKPLLEDVYRNKKHILSANEEKIITELVTSFDSFDDLSSLLVNGEHDYGYIKIDNQKVKITINNYSNLLKNPDAKIRKKIRKQFNEVLNKYSATSAMYLNNHVKTNLTVAHLHHYDDVYSAKLFSMKMPHLAFDTLLNTVEANTKSLQNYYNVFKKVLGLNELTQSDLYLELTNNKKEYSVEEAQDICLKSLTPLGEDYLNKFKKIFDNHYIDYASYPGKCSGAYSLAPSLVDSRILMSFNGNLDSVSTIIHEGGHNVHHQYVSGNNPIEYRDVSSIVCEVASLTNECLLSNYLLKNGSYEEKIAGLNNILNTIAANLFAACREAKVECDFYDYVKAGNVITNEYMNKIFKDEAKKYYGKSVKLDKYSGNAWMTISHYYLNYYLFSYAFCISVASNVAKEIIEGNKEILDKYIKFLKQGSDIAPIEAFKVLDIDLTKEDVYLNAINYFDSLVLELEKLIDERK